MPKDNKIEAAEKELERINAEIAKAEKRLAELRKDTGAFDELRRIINGYRHRLIKFSDLDTLEAKIGELEKRLAAVEKKRGGRT